MRLFIALELTAPVQQALADIQNALRDHLPRARWTKPQGTHLTLKFLGEAQAQQVMAIRAALEEIAARHQPFSLLLSGVGAFPRLSNPRVIWVGLAANENLQKLQADVERAIAPLGFSTENRAFRGHLTLARLEGQSWPPELRQRFLDLAKLAVGIEWRVNQIILFRSELARGGAIYTPLQVCPLAAGSSNVLS